MKKLKMTAAAGGVLVLGIALGSCGGAEEPEGTTPPPAATEAPTAPTEPETQHVDPPAPQPEPEWEPDLDTEEPWGGLFTEEELEANYLEAVRMEPVPPGIRALDDATLLEYGRTVCPVVEAGGTFLTITFPGLDPYTESPVIAGSAVGTWCPELLESAMGEL